MTGLVIIDSMLQKTMKSSDIQKYFYYLLLYFFLIILSALDVKTFSSWHQIEFMHALSIDFVEKSNFFHFYRYLFSYPGLFLKDLYGEAGFSAYVSLFVVINIILWRKILYFFNYKFVGNFSFIIIIVFFMLMNGRGVFVWFSWFLVMLVCLRVYNKKDSMADYFFLIPLSLFSATVSSGIFFVVVATYVTFFIGRFFLVFVDYRFRRKSFAKFMTALLVLLVSIPYLIMGVVKNISYYDYSMEIVSHGFGRYFSDIGMVWLFCSIALVLSVFSIKVMLSSDRQRKLLLLFLYAPLGFGVFGYTILTLTIPIILLFLSSMRIKIEGVPRYSIYRI